MIWRVVTHLNSHDIAAMLGNLNSNHTTYELQSFRLLRGPSVRSRGPRQFNYYYQIPQSAELDPSFVNNPLLWIRIPPAFDQIRVRHIKPALEEGMRLAQLRLQRIIQDQDPPDFSNCSRRIEWASWELDYVLYVGELLASQTAGAFHSEWRESSAKAYAYYDQIYQSPRIYRRLLEFEKSHKSRRLHSSEKRLLSITGDYFRNNGATLSQATRQRTRYLYQRLSSAEFTYLENLNAARNASRLWITKPDMLRGLTSVVKQAARSRARKSEKTGWLFDLRPETVRTILRDSEVPDLRRRLHKRNSQLCAPQRRYSNANIAVKVLADRRRASNTLRYSSPHAEAATATVIESPRRVSRFIKRALSMARPLIEAELEVLRAARSSLLRRSVNTVPPWDRDYLVEKVRTQIRGMTPTELAEYFPLERVLHGVRILYRNLYQAEFEQAVEIPTWHSSVKTFLLKDNHGDLRSIIWADLLDRSGKQAGQWTNPFVERSLDGVTQPLRGISISMQLQRPTSRTPTLLDMWQYLTLHHELGHMFQDGLDRSHFPSLAGTRVDDDLVEFPSLLGERIGLTRESLALCSSHYKSKQSLSIEQCDAIIRAESFGMAIELGRRLILALTDQVLHRDYQPGQGEPPWEYIQRRIGDAVPAWPVEIGLVTSNDYIFGGGYEGTAFSYIAGMAYAAKAFRFLRRSDGHLSRRAGARFRRTVLETGSLQEGHITLGNFFGHTRRTPGLTALMEDVREGVRIGQEVEWG